MAIWQGVPLAVFAIFVQNSFFPNILEIDSLSLYKCPEPIFKLYKNILLLLYVENSVNNAISSNLLSEHQVAVTTENIPE